jgi:hypothetical protein
MQIRCIVIQKDCDFLLRPQSRPSCPGQNYPRPSRQHLNSNFKSYCMPCSPSSPFSAFTSVPLTPGPPIFSPYSVTALSSVHFHPSHYCLPISQIRPTDSLIHVPLDYYLTPVTKLVSLARAAPGQDLLVAPESADYYEVYLAVAAAPHCDCDQVASVGHFVHCAGDLVSFADYCWG